MSAIKLSKSKKADTAFRILLCNSSKELKSSGLTADELSYVQSEEKNASKLVFINRYSEKIFIQFVPEAKSDFLKNEALRLAGSAIAGQLSTHRIAEILISDLGAGSEKTICLAEGIALGSYKFNKYKQKPASEFPALKKIAIYSDNISSGDIKHLQAVVDAVFVARDLVNEPLSYLTAVKLGKEANALGKDTGIKVEVLNKSKIEAMKMGGLLGVNKGSIDPPVFIIMEYKPKGHVNKQPIVLVGKGVVYDTGGLSLKPSDGMMTMKCDMGGAAAAIGAIYATALAELPVWTVTLVPATDNRPDGNAIVPGDVITISDGTTVEVLNTDAEGRLILSDALVYAQKYNPELVIDLATLTGAASRAIGRFGIVAMHNSKEHYNALEISGNRVHERLVEFPLWDDYAEMLKSDIADIKNIGGVVAGANTAGKFLERFTKYPWIHLDIAGPAFLDAPDSYRGKGGTASGLRLLFDYLKKRTEA